MLCAGPLKRGHGIGRALRASDSSRPGLRPQKIDMQNTRPGKCKDQTKTNANAKRRKSGRGQRFRVQNSEATESSDDSDGSKQYPNNTKTAESATVRPAAAAAATRRATTGRAAAPMTVADHAGEAGGWSLWVVSTG